MASRTQEEILERFREATGALSGASRDGAAALTLVSVPNVLQDVTKAVDGQTGATRSQEGAIATAARVLTPRSEQAESGGSSTASKVASAVLKTGLGFAPLVQGIVRLFGGGSEPEAPVLPRYLAPPPIRLEKALRDGVITDMDYDQTGSIRTPGRPRPVSNRQEPPVAGAAEIEPRPGYGESRPTYGETPRAVINVNVQAMDSRSFLDHSQDIARAVREAMLNLNSINDVVNDL
jgi:hypothetical protein